MGLWQLAELKHTPFQNCGYRGMYNMDLSQIRRIKQIPGRAKPA